MTAWGQVWHEAILTSIGLGFVLIALSIATICLLAELNYRKNRG